jgi:hypothetical protein
MDMVEEHGGALPCHVAVKALQKERRESVGNTIIMDKFKQSLLEAFEIKPVLHSGDGGLSLELSWSQVCSQGTPGSGYTCGMWSLLHTLSISIRHSSSGKAFAEAVRGLIAEHFPCEECRMHFLHEYDHCDHGACEIVDGEVDAGRALIWLWRVHNSVSQRVNEDEGMWWPTREECPQCWSESMGEHEDEIAKYVVEYYNKGDEKRGGSVGGGLEEWTSRRISIALPVIFGVLFCGLFVWNRKERRRSGARRGDFRRKYRKV